MPRRYAVLLIAALVALSGAPRFQARAQVVPAPLPTSISDKAFWGMIADFSEPGGLFPSDNFVSNETTYQDVIPALKDRSLPDGVYVGVGPEQNLTYIAALQPRLAFIIDIRRQNLLQHLLYKAVVELSNDRTDFLARLFSRPKPSDVLPSATPEALFDAFRDSAADEGVFRENLTQIEHHLVERHGFPLSADDLRTLEYIYGAFFSEGPDLRYSFPRRRAAPWFPTFAALMIATDAAGRNHSYLASEESFRALRDIERKNLLIPLVGDFAGDKAIRAVGHYLAEHGATLNYFYTSNVEQYLFQSDAWRRYYASVAAMPLNEKSTFIRAFFNAGYIYPPGIISPDLRSVQLLDPILDFLNAFGSGHIHTYNDVVGRGH